MTRRILADLGALTAKATGDAIRICTDGGGNPKKPIGYGCGSVISFPRIGCHATPFGSAVPLGRGGLPEAAGFFIGRIESHGGPPKRKKKARLTAANGAGLKGNRPVKDTLSFCLRQAVAPVRREQLRLPPVGTFGEQLADELVDALAAEAARLGRDYHGTYGYGYLAWRRRLDDLIDDQRPERDEAHTALLEIYERAGAES